MYFFYKKEWARRNDPTDKDTDADKALLRTWTNEFDWWSMIVCCLSSFIQIGCFTSIIVAFKVSR